MALFGFKKRVNSDGSPVATDGIVSGSATNYFQLVKIALGALGTDDGPVSSANPLPVSGTLGTSPTLTTGNVISQGTIDEPTLTAAGLSGVIAVNYTSTPIRQIMVFNLITSFLQISFDGGLTWMTLYPEASPTIDWAVKGLKLEADVIVRKAPSITVTGDSICVWGVI